MWIQPQLFFSAFECTQLSIIESDEVCIKKLMSLENLNEWTGTHIGKIL